MSNPTAENRVTCQLCYGQNGAHQKGCVDYKEPLPSNPLLPEYTLDKLVRNHPFRLDADVLSGPYTPVYLAKREIERLTAELSESREHAGRMLAKQCRLTGEKDRLRVFVEEVAGMDCARYTKAVHSGDPKWSCGMCLSCRARALAGEDRPKSR